MKSIFAILSVFAVISSPGKEIVLGDTKDHHEIERFVWEISEKRIEKLPNWEKGKAPPLSPSEAEALAFKWTRTQEIGGFIPPRPIAISLVTFPDPYSEKYYYKVYFSSKEGYDTFWTVHITLDGNIIEPKLIEPNKSVDSTPVSAPR